MGRGVAIALAVSLAANVFLGGVIAGRLTGPSLPHGERGEHSFHRGMDAFKDLPPAARDSLKRAFMQHRAASKADFDQMRTLHNEFVAVLGADVFDRGAAEAIAVQFETLENSRRAGMARLLIDAAEGLSAEDRKALAAHVDRRGGWRGGHHRMRRGQNGDEPPPGPPPAD